MTERNKVLTVLVIIKLITRTKAIIFHLDRMLVDVGKFETPIDTRALINRSSNSAIGYSNRKLPRVLSLQSVNESLALLGEKASSKIVGLVVLRL